MMGCAMKEGANALSVTGTWTMHFSPEYTPEELNSALTEHALLDVATGISSWLGTTVVKSVTHAYPGMGVSVCAILSSSHVIIHTYPETYMMTVDLHVCCESSGVWIRGNMVNSILCACEPLLPYVKNSGDIESVPEWLRCVQVSFVPCKVSK